MKNYLVLTKSRTQAVSSRTQPYPSRTQPYPIFFSKFFFCWVRTQTYPSVPNAYPYLERTRYGYYSKMHVPVLHRFLLICLVGYVGGIEWKYWWIVTVLAIRVEEWHSLLLKKKKIGFIHVMVVHEDVVVVIWMLFASIIALTFRVSLVFSMKSHAWVFHPPFLDFLFWSNSFLLAVPLDSRYSDVEIRSDEIVICSEISSTSSDKYSWCKVVRNSDLCSATIKNKR